MEHKSNWHRKVPFGLLFIETNKTTKIVNKKTLAKTRKWENNKQVIQNQFVCWFYYMWFQFAIVHLFASHIDTYPNSKQLLFLSLIHDSKLVTTNSQPSFKHSILYKKEEDTNVNGHLNYKLSTFQYFE
jgi:hypothetical protein